mmetsp:Transcript_2370/g.5972  ORF Transcript_2370/g.5972 Transcript_2370/m.5972 type:complete len:250 (-) Transcript_2370:1322-2071(-)
MTISLTAMRRSSEAKNMCSVRTSPMPCAPLRRASAASSGVSAFVKTFTFLRSSTHPMKVPRSPEMVGGARASRPSITSPVLPLSESQSPVLYVLPPSSQVLSRSLTTSSWHPDTHVLPQPLATTAACDVMPPLLVRMPSAACMPLTSSGEVSARTRMAAPPWALKASASSGVKTIWPTAAPGDAGSPLPITRSLYASSEANWGWRSWSRCEASTMPMAWSLLIRPSLNMSTAILTAEGPVRLPLRHWSI